MLPPYRTVTQNHTMSHRGCPSRGSAEGRGMRTSHSQFGGPFSERRTQELAQDFRFIPGLGIRPAWSTAWHIKRSRGTGFVLDIRVDSIIDRTGHMIQGHVDCFLLRTASKPLVGASILLQRCRALACIQNILCASFRTRAIVLSAAVHTMFASPRPGTRP